MKFMVIAVGLTSSICFASYNDGPARVSQVEGTFSKAAHIEFKDEDLGKVKVPAGFKVTVAAKNMGHSRMMILGPDVIYISDPNAGEISTFTENSDGTLADKKIIVSGIDKANGMILHAGKLYFVAVQKIYELDISKPNAKPKVIVEGLPSGGQHGNRVIHEGPDGYLYVSIGSTCNSCHSPDKDSATLQKMKFDGTDRSLVAEGLRDMMAFDWQPKTNALYGVDNGTDWRGDNIPPEKLNRIESGSNYGWPFCWGDKQPDPNLIDEPKGSNKKEFCKTTVGPVLTFTAHSAPIDFKFYTGTQFPEAYKNVAFASMHGSWNRKHPSGYRVFKVTFDAKGAAHSEEFMSGFLNKEGTGAFGRPAGLLVDRDGSLLVSDDEDGIVYRVSYSADK